MIKLGMNELVTITCSLTAMSSMEPFFNLSYRLEERLGV